MKSLYPIQRKKTVYLSFVILFLIFAFLAACSAPTGLKGVWEAERQECLFKDVSGVFNESFPKERRYILEFKENNQVDLVYRDLKVSAVLAADPGKDKEEIQCDVIFEGTYSYSPLGSLEFNFAHDETGAYTVKRGEDCDTDLRIEFKKMPDQSPYIGDPSVSVKKVNAEDLHLAFSGFPKCKGDKMITVFKRK